MFTYVCLGTNNLERAAQMYDAALAPLGIERCPTDWEGWAGWGTYADNGRKEIALWLCPPFDGQAASAGNGTMLALGASSWAQVDAFYNQALAHGGSSEGAPGLRPQYDADFYAAYLRDCDGHKLAVVCRGFTSRAQSEAAQPVAAGPTLKASAP